MAETTEEEPTARKLEEIESAVTNAVEKVGLGNDEMLGARLSSTRNQEIQVSERNLPGVRRLGR